MLRQIDQLGARVLDACSTQILVGVLVFRQQLNDRRRQRSPAHKDHARNLGFAHERHDAAGNGHGDARTVAQVAESVEAFVVEEQLRDEERSARILLLFQMLHARTQVVAFDMPFRIRRGPYAESCVDQARYEVFRITEVLRLGTGHAVAAQGKHVADAKLFHFGNLAVNVFQARIDARQVRYRRNTVFFLDHLGNLRRCLGVAAAAGGICHAHEIRGERREPFDHLARLLERQVALRRKHLEGNRLVGRREHVRDLFHAGLPAAVVSTFLLVRGPQPKRPACGFFTWGKV